MLLIAIYTMISNRSLRNQASKNLYRKQSNTTTLTSTSQSKRMRARSFQDEPFPQDLPRRLLGHKLKPLDFSEDEEEGSVVVEEEQGEGLQQKHTIPHFIVMSDHGEFAERGRLKEAAARGDFYQRCRSVQLHRLPQVDEEKREDDQKRISRTKLYQVKDRNEFGQRKSLEVTPLMDLDSKEGHCGGLQQRIIEAETEQHHLERHNRHDKYRLTSELDKLKVDEIDQHRRSREQQHEIEQIIEEDRQEEETASVKMLRLSLERLEHEGEYLSKFKQDELRVSIHEEEDEDEQTEAAKEKQKIKGQEDDQEQESSQ